MLPIVERELRVSSRRAATHWMRFFAVLAAVVFWAVLMSAQRWASVVQKGHQIFTALGILALAFSLLAGVFLTADCLSEEQREGTLGLLFLTDLRGYDVVLGKLVAHSLQASFGLMAIFPVLALPLLMGGVTMGEFWRLVLLLLVTLFFSLGLGMISSVLAREARQAVLRCLLAITFFAGFCPALWWIQHLLVPRWQWDVLLLPSPAFAFRRLFSFGPSQVDYWFSLLTFFLLGLGAIVMASVLLPWRWRRVETAGRRDTAGPRFRNVPRGALTGTFAENPFYWLASRDSLSRTTLSRVMAVLLPLWAIFLLAAFIHTSAPPGFIGAMFTAFALHLVCKIIIAMEASRRLSDDRQSGALELLLVTPLSPQAIVAGQRAALKDHFRLSLVVLSMMNIALLLITLTFHEALSMGHKDQLLFFEIFAGGVAVLYADTTAISWVAMAAAMRTRKHHRAVLNTLLRVMAVPWILLALLIFSEPRVSTEGAALIIGGWFIAGLVIDGILVARARWTLAQHFRNLAAPANPKTTPATHVPPVPDAALKTFARRRNAGADSSPAHQ